MISVSTADNLREEVKRLRDEEKLEREQILKMQPKIDFGYDAKDKFNEMISSFKKEKNGNYKLRIPYISWERLCDIMEGVLCDETVVVETRKRKVAGRKADILEQLIDLGLPEHCIKYITAHKDGTYTIRLINLPYERSFSIARNLYDDIFA